MSGPRSRELERPRAWRKGIDRSLRSRTPSLPGTLAMCALLVSLSACGEGGSTPAGGHAGSFAPARRVVLVTIDTTRADRIGSYGYAAAQTPAIDRLASEGILFEKAYAPAPVTLPSHASILTGVYPTAHGVQDNAVFQLAPQAQLVSEVLQARGWRTAAFVGSMILDARYGLNQGFDVYRAPLTRKLGNAPDVIERRADEVVGDVLPWLATVGPTDSFFLWVHFYDPHSGYDPPERFSSLADPYDGEIAFCDEQLGRLLEALRARGLDEELMLVVTSDHGEGLGDHREQTHGIFLYEATMRVPLVVVLPGRAHAGSRVRLPVSVTDIPPTILEVAHLSRDEMRAVRVPSLLEAMTEDLAESATSAGTAGRDGELRAGERALYLESFLPYHSFRWHPFRGLVWNLHKYIEGREAELFDLARDPGEVHDLAPEQPEIVATMRARLEQLAEEHRGLGWQEGQFLDEADRDRLAALGYVGLARGQNPFDPSLPDPRGRLADLALREEAGRLIMEGAALLTAAEAPREEGREVSEAERAARRQKADDLLNRARSLLEEIRKANPQDPSVSARLGSLETMRGRWAEAIPELEEAVLRMPTAAVSHYNLAVCYAHTGHLDWAVRQMEKAISCEPSFLRAHRWIVQHYLDQEEFGRALWWLRHYEGVATRAEVDLADVRAWIQSTLARMRAKRQSPIPPEHFPAKEFVPEGVRARSNVSEKGAHQ
ncbi:MAG: sulfatase-like hydrolase/transferase [Planctomycetota bacterium]